MVEVAVLLARIVRVVGLAVTVKSLIVTITVAEWVREPLAPVTVTVNVPAVGLIHDNVELPEVPRVTLVGVSVQVMPEGELARLVRLTVPVKPLTA